MAPHRQGEKKKPKATFEVIHDLARNTLPVSPATTSLHKTHGLATGNLDAFWPLGSVSRTSHVKRCCCTLSTCSGLVPPLWEFPHSCPPNSCLDTTPLPPPSISSPFVPWGTSVTHKKTTAPRTQLGVPGLARCSERGRCRSTFMDLILTFES